MTAEQSYADIRRAWRAREGHRLLHLRQLAGAALREASALANPLATEWSATRVILFGSLVRGDPQREDFDIDLAVEGIAPGRRFEAGGTPRLEASRGVHNVDLADVNDRMRGLIDAQGIVLYERGQHLRRIAEIEGDLAALLQERVDRARSCFATEPPDEFELGGVVGTLHDFYGTGETIFKRIAVELDGELPAGGDRHVRLLRDMMLPLPESRPAVIRRPTGIGSRST